MKLLELKQTPIEKYQYLTHLRATNVHLFYRLLANNLKVRTIAPRRITSPHGGLTN
jgi:malate dehydrogenase (oxaloacetate-decarboxylating)(NADP+)